MENKELYYTSSLNVAAYLYCNGFDVKAHEKINNITIFYFEKSKEMYDVVQKYNEDIVLKKFITSFKYIKELAHK